MKKPVLYLFALLALWGAAGCQNDIPTVNLGIDDTYYVSRMTKLPLESAFTGSDYAWTVERPDGTRDTVSRTRDYIFLAKEEGTYRMTFDVIDAATPFHHEFEVNVLHEEVEYSPYITCVQEYCPAPGQFVNEMPRHEEGDTYADMLEKAEDCISGTNDVMISLGGWGGYVTFSFDHTVVNVPGEYDFRIWGNCFYELNKPEDKGGSAEPGIVWVSYDANCNGIPDDPWYELAGSEYKSPTTLHGYAMTYHRPDPDRIIETDYDHSIDDLNYIRWTDNQGNESHMPKNMFHNQEYYPRWVEADTLSFSGSCLAPNAKDTSGKGTYYILYSYPWGYADNHPNDFGDLNSFDISWAVDAQGNPVSLPGADFVRVQTGLNQYCGWLGETSTEICRARDLHIEISPALPDVPLKDNVSLHIKQERR